MAMIVIALAGCYQPDEAPIDCDHLEAYLGLVLKPCLAHWEYRLKGGSSFSHCLPRWSECAERSFRFAIDTLGSREFGSRKTAVLLRAARDGQARAQQLKQWPSIEYDVADRAVLRPLLTHRSPEVRALAAEVLVVGCRDCGDTAAKALRIPHDERWPNAADLARLIVKDPSQDCAEALATIIPSLSPNAMRGLSEELGWCFTIRTHYATHGAVMQ